MTQSLHDAIPAWPQPTGAELDMIDDVLRSGAWGSAAGHYVKDFEAAFAEYQGARHGLACANGTLALVAALGALDLPFGTEVIVPSYTFFATAAAPAFAGLVPVFCDTAPGTWLMDPDRLESLIGPHTGAIMPVHLSGALCDMDAILAVAHEHGLPVIEDAAQAAGARWRGRGVPVADMATFSFQTSKNVPAGEGGIILTDDDDLAERLYAAINVGRAPGGGWYDHVAFGLNLRLSEMAGAVLTAQLAQHPQQQRVRQANAERLYAALAPVDGIELSPVAYSDGSVHGQHLFLMRFPGLSRDQRAHLVTLLRDGGLVHANPGYVPLHRNEPLLERAAAISRAAGREPRVPDCAGTDALCDQTVWLPQNTLLAEPETIDRVAALVVRSFEVASGRGV